MLENLQRNDVEGAGFGGLQPYGWRHAVLVGLQPTGRTDAPMVARLEPRKSVGRGRSTQIVALGLAVAQKGLVHHAADAVAAVVGGVGAAASVSKPAGHWLAAADL